MKSASLFSYRFIDQFQCLQDKCPSSCCSVDSWNVKVYPSEIKKYKEKNAPILNLIKCVEENTYAVHKKSNTKSCIALKSGLCEIHAKYGEDELPLTCKSYPRTYRSINNVTLKSANGSCPEIMRYCLFEDAPFTIKSSHDQNFRYSKSKYENLETKETLDIIRFFIDTITNKKNTLEHSISQIIKNIFHLRKTPYNEWKENIKEEYRIDSLSDNEKTISPENDFHIEITRVIAEIFCMSQEHEKSLNKYISHIASEKNFDKNEKVYATSKDIALYNKKYKSIFSNIIKRFIALEITRTSFPFPNNENTEFSKKNSIEPYGNEIFDWTKNLFIQYLAVKQLLFLNLDTIEENGIEDVSVPLLYNLCRSINHQTPGPIASKFYKSNDTEFLLKSDRFFESTKPAK